jgi:prepilin-type N-terminal cleavage/methylation domain-containing protein
MNARTSEDGFSLVEILVAIALFSVLSVGFYQVMLAQARTADTTRSISRIADEARLGFNRMIREVREADNITHVSADKNQFTIQINYNGDSFYTTAAHEILTFTYDPVAETISMCSALTHTACTSSNTAILMAGVDQVTETTPVFTFAGNNLEWDWYGPTGTGSPPDGVVSWEEIDEASDVTTHNVVGVGDNDDVLDAPEFPYLSTIKFALQGEDGARATTFYATVQMRNKVSL